MRIRSGTLAAPLALLLLAGCTQGSGSSPAAGPATSTSATPSDGAPWTPEQGYVANQELPDRLSSLVAAPVWIKSAEVRATPAGGCLSPYAPEIPCGIPAISVDLVVVGGAQQTTVTVTESVERERLDGKSRCVPDLRAGGIHPTAGYHCSERLPWTKVGDTWVTTIRVGNSIHDCREESVLRRGAVSVLVQEPLPEPWCDRQGDELDAVPLTDAQLQTLAAATPLVTALSIYGPKPTPAVS